MMEQEQKAKDLAISSLAISVACIPFTLGFLSFIGAIIGHIALGKLRQTQNLSHRGFATAGIIVGWTASAIALIATTITLIFIIGFFGSNF